MAMLLVGTNICGFTTLTPPQKKLGRQVHNKSGTPTLKTHLDLHIVSMTCVKRARSEILTNESTMGHGIH